jgi:peptidoglycan/LPS O-acetylase OafA/YrhL
VKSQLQSYRPDIDGLRALAIIIVIGFHYFPQLFHGGYLGVDIFFVISGYLITQILINQEVISIKEFYIRRIARLVPSLIAILLFSMVCGWFLLLPDAYMRLGKHVISGVGFFSNMTYLREVGYFDLEAHSKILLHLWSLGVEMQFYLAWSLALVVMIKFRLNVFMATVGLLLTSFLIFYSRSQAEFGNAFYMLDSRAWQLLIGGLCAQLDSKRNNFRLMLYMQKAYLSFMGFGCIILGLMIIEFTQKFNIYASLSVSIGTGLIIFGGHESWFNKKILSRPIAILVGKISYPLYLWHWLLLIFGITYWGSETGIIERISLIFLSLLLAWMTYRWIEPIFRVPKNNAKSKRLKIAILLISLMILGGFGHYIYKNKGLVQRLGYPREGSAWIQLTQEDFKWGLHVRSGDCHIQSTKSTDVKLSCIERGDKKLAILWGDSYASSLYPGILEHQKNHNMNYRLGQLTSAGCPPYLGVEVTDHRKNCGEINKKSLRLIESSKPSWLIIHANFRDPRNHLSFNDELHLLDETISKVQSMKDSPKIILVGQVPIWKKDLLQLLSESIIKDPLHGLPPSTFDSSLLNPDIWMVDKNLRQLALSRGISYLSPLDVFCDQNKNCMTRVGDTPLDALSIDVGHLSSAASRFLIKRLFAEIKFN